MRILQLVQKPQRRGAEVFAFQLTGELRRLNHRVRIVYLYPHERQNPLPLAEPDDVLLVGDERSILEKMPGFNPMLLKSLNRIVRDFKPDIIQANGSRTLKYAAFASEGKGAVIYRNIGNPQDWVKGILRPIFYKKLVMPRIDGIVGVSRATLNAVIAFYHLKIPSVHIPRGIDLRTMIPQQARKALRQSCSVPEEAPILLFVGSLTFDKRPDRFLRIVARVKEMIPDIRAWMLGEGPLEEKLKRDVTSYGLQGVVSFFGVQKDVASFIRACDLLLLTSDTEGIPGVILEAGSAGIPTVATNVGGVAECIRNNETGILIPVENEERFLDAVVGLLKNADQRKQMGEQAIQWVHEHFDIVKVAAKYLEFYRVVQSCGRK